MTNANVLMYSLIFKVPINDGIRCYTTLIDNLDYILVIHRTPQEMIINMETKHNINELSTFLDTFRWSCMVYKGVEVQL